ncbi:hypothetical protein AB0I28_12460 [Phytomonospora sp. NPDC050363]|uniref:hypothetical protein n=1 Tax=Phytomonospora sp. NPDC050363 TaxID=3155642 RepID=UPI0034054B81
MIKHPNTTVQHAAEALWARDYNGITWDADRFSTTAREGYIEDAATAVVSGYRERAEHFAQFESSEARMFTQIFNGWADDIESTEWRSAG